MSNFDDWLADTVRYTVFPVDQAADIPDWQALTGKEPEKRDDRPRLGVTRESGVWGETGGTLDLHTDPGRVHLRISHEINEAAGPGPQNVVDVLADLHALSNAWLLALPPLSRVAFGTVLLRPLSSREEGYGLLDNYLSAVDVDPKGSQDFLYRVNRPRDVDIGEDHPVTVNRLSTWSVLAVRSLIMPVGGGTPEEIQVAPSVYHLRLELDISTALQAATQFPTDPNKYAGVFDKLVALGEEIADQGDIP